MQALTHHKIVWGGSEFRMNSKSSFWAHPPCRYCFLSFPRRCPFRECNCGSPVIIGIPAGRLEPKETTDKLQTIVWDASEFRIDSNSWMWSCSIRYQWFSHRCPIRKDTSAFSLNSQSSPASFLAVQCWQTFENHLAPPHCYSSTTLQYDAA